MVREGIGPSYDVGIMSAALFQSGLFVLLIFGVVQAVNAQMPDGPTKYGDALTEESSRAAAEQVAAAGKRELEVHDPSTIIREGGRYWVFSTGPGVRAAYSDDLVEWHRAGSLFAISQLPGWITDVAESQKGHFWAPDAVIHNGRFLVYYSVSAFGKQTSAIALASTPTLDIDAENFGWTDHGIVVQTSETSDHNAIDPAVFFDQDGRLWMAYGSFWTGLKLIELDPDTGMRIAPDSPTHALAWNDSIEAPAIVFHDGFYYLFVNWGRCCNGMNSTYNIRVGRSRDVVGPYVDKDGKPMMEGGGSAFLGTAEPAFIGPGHVGVFVDDGGTERLSVHFYDGTQEGKAMLALRELRWDDDGWPHTPGPGSGAEYEGWERRKP